MREPGGQVPVGLSSRSSACEPDAEAPGETWVSVFRVLRPRRGELAARAGETVEIELGPERVFLS